MARRQSDVAWSDPALLILGSLASGPKHGYGIVQDTESTVGITLGPGTLYAGRCPGWMNPTTSVPSRERTAAARMRSPLQA
jgi:hypothetical protein